jgi:hypothetical protein
MPGSAVVAAGASGRALAWVVRLGIASSITVACGQRRQQPRCSSSLSSGEQVAAQDCSRQQRLHGQQYTLWHDSGIRHVQQQLDHSWHLHCGALHASRAPPCAPAIQQQLAQWAAVHMHTSARCSHCNQREHQTRQTPRPDTYPLCSARCMLTNRTSV